MLHPQSDGMDHPSEACTHSTFSVDTSHQVFEASWNSFHCFWRKILCFIFGATHLYPKNTYVLNCFHNNFRFTSFSWHSLKLYETVHDRLTGAVSSSIHTAGLGGIDFAKVILASPDPLVGTEPSRCCHLSFRFFMTSDREGYIKR